MDLSRYFTLKIYDLIPSVVLDLLKSCEGIVNDSILYELIPCCIDEFASEINDQSKETVKSGQQFFGIGQINVCEQRIKVNLNEIPSSLAVNVVPAYESTQDFVGVFNNVLKNFISVVNTNVSEDGNDHVRVFNEERSHIVAVFSEEFDHHIGVIVEPVVEILIYNGKLSENQFYELVVFLRKVRLEVIFCENNDFLYRFSCSCNDLNHILSHALNDCVKLCNGSLVLSVQLCAEICQSNLCISSHFCNFCLNVSLDCSNCGIQLSLDASNFCLNGSLCLINCSLQLSIELCDLCLSLCLELSDLCLGSSLGDSDLLLNLSHERCDIRISIFTGINDRNHKEICDISGVGCQRAEQVENVLVALCIQLVSVVNQCTYCIYGVMSVCNSSLNLSHKCLASCELAIGIQPCFSIVDVLISKVKISVQLSNQTLFLCLVVCVSVSFVIVLKEEITEHEKVLDGFFLCSIFILIRRNQSICKSIVSGCGRMRAESVTDYATAEQTKQTLELTLCHNGAESIGGNKESCQQGYIFGGDVCGKHTRNISLCITAIHHAIQKALYRVCSSLISCNGSNSGRYGLKRRILYHCNQSRCVNKPTGLLSDIISKPFIVFRRVVVERFCKSYIINFLNQIDVKQMRIILCCVQTNIDPRLSFNLCIETVKHLTYIRHTSISNHANIDRSNRGYNCCDCIISNHVCSSRLCIRSFCENDSLNLISGYVYRHGNSIGFLLAHTVTLKVSSHCRVNFILKQRLCGLSHESANGIKLSGNLLSSSFIVSVHNSTEVEGAYDGSQTENLIQAGNFVLAINNCLFESKIDRKSHCPFNIGRPALSLFHFFECKRQFSSIAQSVIVENIFIGRIIVHRTGEQSPNHAATITNDRLYKTVTDNGISIGSSILVEIQAVLSRHALYVGSFRIVEGSILVSCIVNELHVGGKCCDERVHRSYDRIHQRAKGYTLNRNRSGLLLLNKGVHDGNHHDLCIGIQFKNRLNGACVAEHQGNTDVNGNVSKLLEHFVGFQIHAHSFLNYIVKLCLELKNHFLHFRIQLADSRLDFINRLANNGRTAEANCFKNSSEAEYAQVTVTNTERNDVSLSNVLLEVLCNQSYLLSAVLFVAHIGSPIESGGIYEILVKLSGEGHAGLIIVRTAHDCEIGCIQTRMVANLLQRPIVAGGELCIPLFFVPIAIDQLLDQINCFLIVVIQLKKPMEVFRTDTRHSELRVVNFVGNVFLKPFGKLVRIGNSAVRLNAGVQLISRQTIAVGHGVAKGYIVNFVLFGFMVVIVTGQRADCGSAKTKQHGQRQQETKNARTYSL